MVGPRGAKVTRRVTCRVTREVTRKVTHGEDEGVHRNEGAVRRGRWGETVAANHLRRRGWTVLSQNWRDGPRELDLVVRRGPTLAFVEVKTRTGYGGHTGGHPLESLTWRKRREVERAARAWLGWYRDVRDGKEEVLPPPPSAVQAAAREPWPREIRFDAVVVRLEAGRPARIEHVPDAWRPGWDRR